MALKARMKLPSNMAAPGFEQGPEVRSMAPGPTEHHNNQVSLGVQNQKN